MTFVSSDLNVGFHVTVNAEFLIVLPDVTVRSETETFLIEADGVEISNFGSLLAGTNAIWIYPEQSGGAVINGAGALIFARDVALLLGSAYATVTNAGHIASNDSTIWGYSHEQRVHNQKTGTIQSGNIAVALGGEGARFVNEGSVYGHSLGLSVDEDYGRVINSGSLSGGGYGVLVSGNASMVRNSGEISGPVAGYGLTAAASGAFFHNSGTVEGEVGIRYFNTSGLVRIVNTGTISGDTHSVQASATAPLELRNFGTLDGKVSANAGQDSIRNAGEILGDVDLAGGADFFNGAGGSVAGVVFGGEGNDELIAGDGDRVEGGLGVDTLRGRGDIDWLVGGGGPDRLIGGYGIDYFVFAAAIDSPPAQRDRIVSFDRASDFIDLSAIDARTNLAGDQDFTFIGTGAFTNVAGQLRVATLGTTLLVEGDVNGDGTADLQILVMNAPTQAANFAAADFVL